MTVEKALHLTVEKCGHCNFLFQFLLFIHSVFYKLAQGKNKSVKKERKDLTRSLLLFFGEITKICGSLGSLGDKQQTMITFFLSCFGRSKNVWFSCYFLGVFGKYEKNMVSLVVI